MSILSDELLRSLIAAGQVDVLVGVPSFNNEDSIGGVVRAVHVAFEKLLTRERTLLVNADGGSTDGTSDAVRAASTAEERIVSSQALRTIHRISAPYHGLPGKASALRTLFTAAELVQARAIVIVDPDVTSITPEWVMRLAGPVLNEGYDFVAPGYARHPLDGPLVTQLVRPLVRAAYGRRLHEPLGGEFGCSARFAVHCLNLEAWDDEWLREGVDLWLTLSALAGDFRCGQAALGPRTQAARAVRPGLPEVIQQVVGALFTCLESHQDYWVARAGSEDLPALGTGSDAGGEAPALDAAPLAESFRAGARDLEPLFEQILPPPVGIEVRRAIARDGIPEVTDETWARIVYAFAAADHARRMPRQHLVQALVPLYLGRAASFIAPNAGRDPASVEERLEALALEYERSKPWLVERWNPESGR